MQRFKRQMTAWDIDKLADEIARVATPRLGWPLRSNAKTEQLRRMSEALTGDLNSDGYLLYEKVLPPSIEQLGPGPMGRLARIEFGLTEDSKSMPFLKQRRYLALKKLGIRPNAIERLERDMRLAIARDLVARWTASQPAKKNSYIENRLEERFPGMSTEERSRAEFIDSTRRLMDRAGRHVEEEIMAGEITEEEIDEDLEELKDVDIRRDEKKR